MTANENSRPPPRERFEQLVDLSPSAKYVYTILKNNGTLTQDEIIRQTLLPRRTVQYALDTLKDEDLVEKEIDANDARCRKYSPVPITRPSEND